MRKLFSLILLLAMVFLLAGCDNPPPVHIELNTDFKAPTTLEDGEGRKVKVILLLGQSNATGCALNSYLETNVGEERYSVYESGFSNIWINYSVDNENNSSNGEFVKTAVGCGHIKDWFGPELGIAEKLSREYPDETFVILKYTYSGSCLATQWLDGRERGQLHDAAVKFASTYMDALLSHNYDASIGAICWMQGESDAIGTIAGNYYKNQSRFVSYLRNDLDKYADDGGIYFIDAGIQDNDIFPKYETVNRAKERFAERSDMNLYFSTIDAGLTTLFEPEENPDIAHYDSMSTLKLGHLFGEQIIYAYSKSR